MKFDLRENIVYEDNHLICVNKPFGLLSQKDITDDDSLIELVKAYIKEEKNKPGDVFLGSVHRLDRPTTGVIIYCKTSKATNRMNALFKNRAIKKKYWAISSTQPRTMEGVLEDYLIKDHGTNKVKVAREKIKDAKLAKLSYQVLAINNGYSLFEIIPETGRSHQIRVQLAALGCPIVGDRKYGRKKDFQKGVLGLHCLSMSFVHPVQQIPIELKASLPEHKLWKQFETYLS